MLAVQSILLMYPESQARWCAQQNYAQVCSMHQFMTGATIQGHGAANHFSHVASHYHAPPHSADGNGASGFGDICSLYMFNYIGFWKIENIV